MVIPRIRKVPLGNVQEVGSLLAPVPTDIALNKSAGDIGAPAMSGEDSQQVFSRATAKKPRTVLTLIDSLSRAELNQHVQTSWRQSQISPTLERQQQQRKLCHLSH